MFFNSWLSKYSRELRVLNRLKLGFSRISPNLPSINPRALCHLGFQHLARVTHSCHSHLVRGPGGSSHVWARRPCLQVLPCPGRWSPTDLVKGDFFSIPVLDVEEHDHAAILVPSGEDTRVAGLHGAADSLWGQAVEELGVLQPEVHVAWRRESREAPQGASPSGRGPQEHSRDPDVSCV